MIFNNSAAFEWLFLIPALLALIYWNRRTIMKRLKGTVGPRTLPLLTSSVSTARRNWKLILEISAVFFMILALARPQSPKGRQKVKSEGVEIMLMVDVSNSMLAEDARPSRLRLVSDELMRFLDKSSGDRIGLIAFAGTSAVLSPMTPDKSALKMYLESMTPDAVSTQGTNFKKALTAAKEAFERGGIDAGNDAVVTRVVIIASDGEDQEAGAVDAAKELVDQGVRIFTLAVGTEKGGPIPLRNDRGELTGYKKDDRGQTILTQTKGTILQTLADSGKGSFYHLTFGSDTMAKLRNDIDQLQKSEFASADINNYNEEYQLFLLVAVLLGLTELLIGERAGAKRLWKGRFEVAPE